jgi:MarR family
MSPAMSTAREHFVEQMGLITQAEGGPRIAGQILGYLIVEGGPRTLSQMTQALKISKGSASTNARLLERKGVLRRVSVLGQRQDAYQAVDEPGLSTLVVMAERLRDSATAIEAIAGTFSDSDAEARGRVDKLAQFHRQSAAFLDEWTARMSAACAAIPDTESKE